MADKEKEILTKAEEVADTAKQDEDPTTQRLGEALGDSLEAIKKRFGI